MANLSSEERRKRYSRWNRNEDIEQSEANKDSSVLSKADERRSRYASKDYLEKYNEYHAPTRYDGSAVNRYLNAYGLNQQRQADRMQEYRNRYAQQQFMNAQRDAIRNGIDNGNNPLGLKNLENPLDNMRRLEAYKEAYGKNNKLSYDESQKLEKAYGKYNRQQLEQLKEHFKNAPERDYSGEIAWVNEKLLKTATGKENKQRQNILESQIKDADNRLERLQEAYADRLVGGGTDNGDYLDKLNQIKQEKSQLQNELNDYKELTNYSDQDDFGKYKLLGEANPNNPVRFFRTHSDEQANAIFDPTIRNEVDTAHHESTYTGGGSNQSDRALYRAITDEEADNYSYILGKYGQEEADKYLQAVAKHTDVNGSLTALQEAKEQGYKNPLLRTAESIGLGLITPVEAAKNLISGDKFRTYDDYKLAGRQEALRSGAAEKLTGGNEIGTFLYNTATSAADNLLRYAVGGGIGAVTGDAGAAEGAMRLMMGGQVMDSAMKNALDRGLSDSQAVTTALISAVNEELFETISLSNLKAMQSVTPKNYRELAKNIGKQFLGEGSEEMFTDIGNAIADDLINGEKSEIRQNILNYMKQGMSEEEAKKQASVDFALQLVESGLSGGITGAAMGGVVAVDQAKSIKANQKYKELFNTYKESGLSEEDAVNTALSEVMNGLQTVRDKEGNVKDYKGLNKSIDKAIASAKNINENVKNIEAEMNGVAPVVEEDIRDNKEDIRYNEVNNEYLTDMKRVLSHGDITTDAQAQQFLSDQDEMVAKYPDKKDEIIKATVDVYMKGKNNVEVFDSIVSKVTNTMAKNETGLESKNTPSEGISQKEDKPAKVDFKANINGEEAVITSVNKNNMTVRDSVGNETTIPINAAEMTDGASAAVEQAKQYGKRGSRLYLENMAGNIRNYTYTFNDFYNAGKQGKDFYGRNTRGLNTDFLREVYDAGVQDGSKASKTGGLVRNDARYTIQESEARVLDAVGKAFNVTIQMDHMLSHDANGYLSDGIIHISTSAEKPSLVVFSHEFTHRLEDTSPEAYKAYKDYVINYLKKTSDEEGNNVYETRKIDLKNAYASQGVELSDKELQDELVANATESFLSDTDFIEDLVKENKSLAQQILDVLKQMLEDLKNVFAEKYDAKSKEGKALQDDLEAREEALKLWTNAIKNQNKEAIKKNDTRYSMKELETNYDNLAKEYEEAVKEDDEELMGDLEADLSDIVEEYAKKKGFDTLVYHGTQDFGFTKIDTNMSDDKLSFFATDSLEIANSYSDAISEDSYVRKVSDKSSNLGNYEFYANTNNFYEVDAHGQNWNQLRINDNESLLEDINELHNLMKNMDPNIKLEEVYENLDGIADAVENYLTEYAYEAEESFTQVELNRLKQLSKRIDKLVNEWNKSEHYDENGEEQTLYWYLKENKPNYMNTRQIAEMAKNQGYDGVLYKNVHDDGGQSYESAPLGNVYNFFNPQQQVKSADAVTYDDEGNVIPLSERFNKSNDDIRFSLKEDSEGRELSPQQQEYFKDSKVVDEDGNLLVVYHGTEEDFTVFDKTKGRANMDIQGMFFSPYDVEASGYGGKVKAYYLNITNPASESMGYKALNKFKGQNNAGVKAREYLEKLGYDGVANYDEYIAFNPEQIKLIDNTTPTDNPDIRFSLKESNDFYKETGFDVRTITDPTPENIIWYASKNERAINKYLEDRKVNIEPVIIDKKIDNLILNEDIIKNYIKDNDLDIVSLVTDTDVRDKFYNFVENEYINKADKPFIRKRYQKYLDAIKAAVNGDDYIDGYWRYDFDKLDKDINSIKNPTQEEDKYATKNKKRDYVEEHYNDFEKYLGDKIEKIFGWSLNGEKEKASDEDKERHVEDAINRFGTLSEKNRNWNKGAYITLTGDVLDFGGKGSDIRSHDHRDISAVYDEDESTKYRLFNPTDYLNQFLSEGNVRIMPESSSIDMNSNEEPNSKQYATIRDYIDDYAAETGKCIIEFSDDDGRSVDSKYYENNINSSQIINDIKRFYREGKIGGSNLNQFRYSLKEDRSEVEQLINDIYDRKIGFVKSYSIGDLPNIYHELFDVPVLNLIIQPRHAYFNMASQEKVIEDKIKKKSSDHIHNIGKNRYVNLLYKLEDPLAIYNDNNGDSDKPRLLVKLDDRYAAVLELYSDKDTFDNSNRENHAVITIFNTTKTKDGKKRKTSYYKDYENRILYKKEAFESEAFYKIAVESLNQNASYKANISDFKNEVNMYLRNPKEFADHFSTKIKTLADADEASSRFSLKEESNITRNDVAALTGKDPYMAEAVKDLEDIMRMKGGEAFFRANQKELYKIYDEIAEEYNIKDYSKKRFADNVKELFDYIQSVDNPDGVDTTMLAMQIADDMLDKGSIKDTSMEELYPTLQQQLRDYKIKIADQDKADLDGGYNAFRKKYFGSLTLSNDGTEVDSVYEDLASSFPELFPEDITHPGDRLTRIADVADMFRKTVDHIEGATKNESAFIIAQDIINKAVLEQTKNDKSIDNKKRLKAQEKVRKQNTNIKKAKKDIHDDYVKLQNKVKALESINKRLSKNLTKAENELGRQKKEFADWAMGKRQVNKEDKYYKRKYDKLMQEFSKKKVAELQKKYSAERRKNIEKIRKMVNELDRSVRRPDKNHYIPKYLVSSMLDVLRTIDLDSGYRKPDGSETLVYMKLKEMQKQYQEMKNDMDYAIASEYNETIDKAIGRLAEITKGRRLNELLDKDIADIVEIMEIITYQMRTARDLLENEKLSDIKEASQKAREQIKEAGRTFNTDAKLKNLFNRYLNNSLSPVRVMRRLEGYAHDGVLSSLGEELQQGERKTKSIRQKAYAMLDELYKDTKAIKALEKFRSEKLVYNIGGKNIVITPDMRAAIYLHSLNEQNMKHIVGNKTKEGSYRGGGIIIPNYQKQMKFNNRDSVKVNAAEKYTGQDAVRLSPSDVDRIIKDMTEYDKRIVELYQQVNEYLTKELNDTTINLYGFKKATVKNYFPLIVDKSILNLDTDALKFDKTLESFGFLKERVNSAKPIYLEGVMDALERQIDQSSLFSGMAIPSRDFKKVWNYAAMDENDKFDNVNKQAQKAMGSYIDKYVGNLQADLAQARERGDNLALLSAFSRGKMAMSALTGNLSVVLKQAASYPTAAGGVLGYQDLLAGLTPKGQRGKTLEKTMNKYTPLYQDRNTATITGVNINDMNLLKRRNPKLYYALTGWIESMDKATVRRLWYASENYVKRNFNYEVGSDDYYEEVAKVWEDTIRRTQPIYDTMSRPEFLRTTSDIGKFLMMFKTQALQNVGIMVENCGELKARKRDYEKDKSDYNLKELKNAQWQFRKAVSSQIIQSIIFTGITALVDAFIKHRPDKWADEETGLITPESLWDNFIKAWTDNVIGQLAFGDIIRDLGYYPVKTLITGKEQKRFDLSIPPVDAINDIITSTNKIANAVANNDLKKAIYYGKQLGTTAAQYGFGLPVKNIENLYKGLEGNIRDIAAGKNPLETTTTQQMYNRIYLAYQSGNPEIAAELSKNVDPDKIKTKMVSKLKEEDTIKEAADYRYKSELDKYKAIVDAYVSLGFKEDWVVSAISSVMNKEHDTTGSGEYNSNDLQRAIDISAVQGSKVANEIYKEKYDTYKSEGMKDDEAKKKALSSVRSAITGKYKSQYESGTTSQKVKIRDRLCSLRVAGERLYTYDSMKSWNK